MIDLGLGPENNNLIEKLASERAVKSKICNGFSPFFFVFLLFFTKHKQEAAVTGLNLAGGRRWLISGLLGKQTLIEKLSKRTLTFQTCIVFSPFFLCYHSVLINTIRWQQWCGEIWPWEEI